MHHQCCMLFILISSLFTENWAQARNCGFVWSTYWMGQGKIKQKKCLSGKNVQFIPISSKSEVPWVIKIRLPCCDVFMCIFICTSCAKVIVKNWLLFFVEFGFVLLLFSYDWLLSRLTMYIMCWLILHPKVIKFCYVFASCLAFKPSMLDLNRFNAEFSDV